MLCLGLWSSFLTRELSSQASLSDTAAVKGYDSRWLHGHDNVAGIAYQIFQSPEPWLLTEHFWSDFDVSVFLCLLCLQYLPFYFGGRSLQAANRVSDISWYDYQISIDRKHEIWYALSPRLIVRGRPFYFTWQEYLFIALIECPSLLLDRKPKRNLASDHDDSVVRC